MYEVGQKVGMMYAQSYGSQTDTGEIVKITKTTISVKSDSTQKVRMFTSRGKEYGSGTEWRCWEITTIDRVNSYHLHVAMKKAEQLFRRDLLNLRDKITVHASLDENLAAAQAVVVFLEAARAKENAPA